MRKTVFGKIAAFSLALAVFVSVFSPAVQAKKTAKKAKTQTETVSESDEASSDDVKDDGKARHVYVHNKENVMPADYDKKFFFVGDHGFLTFAGEIGNVPGAPTNARDQILSLSDRDDFADVKISYKNDHPEVVTIDEEHHTYRILGGGEASVILNAKIKKKDQNSATGYKSEIWLAKFTFTVIGDASGTKLEKKKISSYMVYDTKSSADVKLIDCPNLKYYSFDYSSSNKDMIVKVDFDPRNEIVHVEATGRGKSEITMYLNGHPMKLIVENKITGISTDHYIMDVGDTVQLTLDEFKGNMVWKSMNKKVATVSKAGLVTAKSVGNAIVYTKIGKEKVGCAVSVVKKGHTAVVGKAAEIGKTRMYSQPMRMSPGFYDCSSLVWMAYQLVSEDFGNSEYAPTAALECEYCEKNGRILGAWTYEDIQKMKYLPGDCLFRTGANNGRYLGIYHVEMFAGYRVTGFDDDGKPILSMCWANRPDDYYQPCGDIFGRP